MSIPSKNPAAMNAANKHAMIKAKKTYLQEAEKSYDMFKRSYAEAYKLLPAFVEDNSYLEDYANYETFGPEILIRIHAYNPPKEDIKTDSGLIIGAGTELIGVDKRSEPMGLSTVFTSIAKVIWVGTECTGKYKDLKPGDLVTVTDDINELHENPQWIIIEDLKKERPAIENLPEVPRMLPKIAQWSNRIFTKDKILGMVELGYEDAATFLVPQTFIKTKYTYVPDLEE